MNIQFGYFTDKGTVKSINEDSLIFRTASTKAGPLVMAAVCDGMGGLNHGDLASSTLVQALSEWFENGLLRIVDDGFDMLSLKSGAEYELRRQSRRMEEYCEKRQTRMGTTAAILLLYAGCAVTVNVGDSRVYAVKDSLAQITKDQSFVQSEVDAGRLTPAEAAVDPRRNILLQCVGQSEYLSPVSDSCAWEHGTTYLLCSDGFHHELKPEEIRAAVNSAAGRGNQAMSAALEQLGRTAMARGERDNITAMAVNIG